MRHPKLIKSFCAVMCVALSQTLVAAKIDEELKDIHNFIASLTAEVEAAWVETEEDEGPMDLGIACAKLIQDVLAPQMGGTNTVFDATCETDHPKIVIQLSDQNINKTLRGGVFSLVGVKLVDNAADGFLIPNREEANVANTQYPLDNFACQFDWGASIGEGDKQNIQLSQPVGTTKKVDHFSQAENGEGLNPRPGLLTYCKGVIEDTLRDLKPVDFLMDGGHGGEGDPAGGEGGEGPGGGGPGGGGPGG